MPGRSSILPLIAATLSAFLPQSRSEDLLQLHFINVHHGDATLIVSPQKHTVLVDCGNDAESLLSYFGDNGFTNLDYFIASHYHSDHIGALAKILACVKLNRHALDRGTNATYKSRGELEAYLKTVGANRQTADPSLPLRLDESFPDSPVIEFVRRSRTTSTTIQDENALSLVAVLRYRGFDAVLGGDLTGYPLGTENRNLESELAGAVGPVEVYKVHHHGSATSSNLEWLTTTQPYLAILSVGDRYRLPNAATLKRIHDTCVRTFWTNRGRGAPPSAGIDVIAGNILIEIPADIRQIRLTTFGGESESTYKFPFHPDPAKPGEGPWIWGKEARIYHYSTCPDAKRIIPSNRLHGTHPPPGKIWHPRCRPNR